MTSSPAEWVMAAATFASLVFLGVQSYYIRESLNDPFEANLQSRQIDVCSRVIKEYGAFRARVSSAQTTYSMLEQVKSGEVRMAAAKLPDAAAGAVPVTSLLPKDVVDTFLSQPETLRALATQNGQNDPREGLLAALTELAVYADTDTLQVIDAVSLSMPTLPQIGALAQFLDQQPQATLGRFEEAFAPLAGLCRDTMLGKKKGLL